MKNGGKARASFQPSGPFWFMSCYCLFHLPELFRSPRLVFPGSLFVRRWQPPVCVSTVLLSASEHTHTNELECLQDCKTAASSRKRTLTAMSRLRDPTTSPVRFSTYLPTLEALSSRLFAGCRPRNGRVGKDGEERRAQRESVCLIGFDFV